jgi:hypothetical protein
MLSADGAADLTDSLCLVRCEFWLTETRTKKFSREREGRFIYHVFL